MIQLVDKEANFNIVFVFPRECRDAVREHIGERHTVVHMHVAAWGGGGGGSTLQFTLRPESWDAFNLRVL